MSWIDRINAAIVRRIARKHSTENDDAWTTVLAALDGHRRSRLRSTGWRLALVAADAEGRLELLD